MQLLRQLLRPNNGTTIERSQYLHSTWFPSYMKLGNRYRIIEKIDCGIASPGDQPYGYMIQVVGGRGPVIFIRSPFDLPKVFWVRGLLSWYMQYEILPENNDGIPLQVQQARL